MQIFVLDAVLWGKKPPSSTGAEREGICGVQEQNVLPWNMQEVQRA